MSRWLAYWMLHLLQKATQIPSHIPSSLSLLGFASLLTPQNFDYAKRKRFSPLRMTYSGFVGRYVLEAGDLPEGGKPPAVVS